MARAKPTTGRAGRSGRSAPQQKPARQRRAATQEQQQRRSGAASALRGGMADAIGESERLWQAGAQRGAMQLHSVLGSAGPMAEGMEQMMRGWVGFLQRAAHSQTRLMQEMLRFGASQDAVQAQFTFVDETLRNVAESTDRVFRASGRIAERAVPALAAAAAPLGRGADRSGRSYRDHLEAQQRQDRDRPSGNGFASGRRGGEAEERWYRD